MRIAVFSDIHGNYYAFKEVLKKADQEGVKHIFKHKKLEINLYITFSKHKLNSEIFALQR